ncbi:MAG: hypothetical protein ACTMKV_02560 [Sphingomonas parapaucimobilis]
MSRPLFKDTAAQIPDLHLLPDQSTTNEAHRVLRWIGTRSGFGSMLVGNGFVRTIRRAGKTNHHVWIRPTSKRPLTQKARDELLDRVRSADNAFSASIAVIPECTCQCHENTCGAADMDMAERTLRLVESLRPIGADVIERLDELVQRAGPAHARDSLGKTDFDDKVPF